MRLLRLRRPSGACVRRSSAPDSGWHLPRLSLVSSPLRMACVLIFPTVSDNHSSFSACLALWQPDLAAVASFRLSLPDSSRLWAILPLPALALWVATIGYGCLTDWVSMDPDGVHMGEAIRCFATLLMTSVPLSIAMLVMLRYAALLRPLEVSVTGGLAVAAVTAFALSLFHDLDATVMILIWNLGVAALIAILGSLFGRLMLTWMASYFTTLPQPHAGP